MNNLIDGHTRVSHVFFREPTIRTVAEMRRWIKAHYGEYVVMYHGTDSRIPVQSEGLLPTSARRRRSLQSQSGYVYLSVFPGMAQTFGEMAYPGRKISVYGVWVMVGDLLPDRDQLANQRAYAGRDFGSDLAASLVVGHGARIKGRIPPSSIVWVKP